VFAINNEIINSLAVAYASTRCNSVFTELYTLLLPEFRRRWRKPDVDPHDCEEAFHVSLDELLCKWGADSGDFLQSLNVRYKSRLTDRLRKRRRRADRVEYSIDEAPRPEDKKSGEWAATQLVDARINVEDDAIKKMTESGRQAIIDHLLLLPQSDNATTRIVAALQVSPFESPTSLGKAAGVHHEVVKRKLRALSRRYDGNRFGDIRDYLAV